MRISAGGRKNSFGVRVPHVYEEAGYVVFGVSDKHCEWRLVASFDWLKKLGLKADFGKYSDRSIHG